jgi:hypothetical protein
MQGQAQLLTYLGMDGSSISTLKCPASSWKMSHLMYQMNAEHNNTQDRTLARSYKGELPWPPHLVVVDVGVGPHTLHVWQFAPPLLLHLLDHLCFVATKPFSDLSFEQKNEYEERKRTNGRGGLT